MKTWMATSTGKTWMATLTGIKFYPLEPREEDVDVRDVARGLALTCRYGGQTARSFYSVAEHSVLVSRHVAPEFAREALMHDATEAYLGDLIRPLKTRPEMYEFRKAEARLDACLARKFRLRRDRAALAAVDEVDHRIVVDEVRVLMSRPEIHDFGDLAPVGAEILGYSPEASEVLFLARFGELFPEFVDPLALRVDL